MLQKSYTSDYGITHTEAVHKVCSVLIDDEKQTAVVYVGTWVTQQAHTDGKTPVRPGKPYPVVGSEFTTYFADAALQPLDASPVVNAYNYLQTLPEFSGATTV